MSDETQDLTAEYSNRPKIYVGNGQPYRNTVASISIGLKPDDNGNLKLVDFSRVYLVERSILSTRDDHNIDIGISPKEGELLINVLWSAGVRPNWWKSDNESISAHKAHIDSLRDVNRHFMAMQVEEMERRSDKAK